MARKRSSSVQKALDYVANPPQDHSINDLEHKHQAAGTQDASPMPQTKPLESTSAGLWHDLVSWEFMTRPVACLRVISIIVAAYAVLEIVSPINPLRPFLEMSYALEEESQDVQDAKGRPLAVFFGNTRYGKGAWDLCFLAFYTLVFTFIRIASFDYIWRPFAKWCGIRGKSKVNRFLEQGYALEYFGASSIFAVFVMKGTPVWWYNTTSFWVDYPHWRMNGELKCLYLLELSYWIQQCLVMILRLEKPRPDFVEYLSHHVVTIWLVGWSYSISLTYIGIAVFFSMDVADAFLANAKLLNYMGLQRTSECAFVIFLGVWTYFRHYLNIIILKSVWTEFDLIPETSKFFRPSEGVWLTWWMKYQVFAPLFLLQLLNLFWYYLILRILFRVIRGTNATDIREDEESDGEEDEKDK